MNKGTYIGLTSGIVIGATGAFLILNNQCHIEMADLIHKLSLSDVKIQTLAIERDQYKQQYASESEINRAWVVKMDAQERELRAVQEELALRRLAESKLDDTMSVPEWKVSPAMLAIQSAMRRYLPSWTTTKP